jgi:hypothetical protein
MGKDYGGRFYELLTMGLEGVFYRRHGILMNPGRAELAAIRGIKQLLREGTLTKPELDSYERKLRELEGDQEFVHWIMGVLAVV